MNPYDGAQSKRKGKTMRTTLWMLALLWSGFAQAGEADVVEVSVTKQGEGRYTFGVALRHADEGWDHYANAWEVLSLGGKVLGTRTLTTLM